MSDIVAGQNARVHVISTSGARRNPCKAAMSSAAAGENSRVKVRVYQPPHPSKPRRKDFSPAAPVRNDMPTV
jgi:hypothetical protein